MTSVSSSITPLAKPIHKLYVWSWLGWGDIFLTVLLSGLCVERHHTFLQHNPLTVQAEEVVHICSNSTIPFTAFSHTLTNEVPLKIGLIVRLCMAG